MSSEPEHTSAPWPIIRNAVASTLSLHRKDTMFGMIEADVTAAMEKIAHLRREHRIVTTLHVYTMYCLSRVLAETPELNTYRKGKRLITFADVDIGTTAEKRIPGTDIRYAAAFVIRAAQKLTLAALNRHMRIATQRDPATDETAAIRRRFARLPAIVRWFIGKRVGADPFKFKRIYGTVALTSLNLADLNRPYFTIPPNPYTLTVATGGVSEKYVIGSDGRSEKRRFLSITLAVDHAIVDGIMACRFGRALVLRLEAGEGLDEAFVAQALAMQEPAS